MSESAYPAALRHVMTLSLDEPCTYCHGTGRLKLWDGDVTESCPDCGGLGLVPTEQGHALLLFLERHTWRRPTSTEATPDERDE